MTGLLLSAVVVLKVGLHPALVLIDALEVVLGSNGFEISANQNEINPHLLVQLGLAELFVHALQIAL